MISMNSALRLEIADFLRELEMPLTLEFEGCDEHCRYFYFSRPKHSTTLFVISDDGAGNWQVMIDGLASYEDYRFFPYLADCLRIHLQAEVEGLEDGKTLYQHFDEEWISLCIGEEIAWLKATLSLAPRYYLEFPVIENTYVSLDILSRFGVNLYSSTPRIYGYVQYLLRHGLLPHALPDASCVPPGVTDDGEVEVDVPQHVPVGKVKSWQTDGAETWESFSREDVELLLQLAEGYRQGKEVAGVVLNDIGTLYQEGVGIPVDKHQAEYWFRQAISAGDRMYAPSNLGDLYRKGGPGFPVSLPLAMQAYRLSEDPYAHYRIGQAYEEGWNGDPDPEKAFYWYRKAADEGHHLAIRRLRKADGEEE